MADQPRALDRLRFGKGPLATLIEEGMAAGCDGHIVASKEAATPCPEKALQESSASCQRAIAAGISINPERAILNRNDCL